VAEAVMRIPQEAVVPAGAPGFPIQQVYPARDKELRRQTIEEDEEEETIQTMRGPRSTPELALDLEAHVNGLRGGGHPLPDPVRSFFEPRLRHDFRRVRIHADAMDAESAQAIQARAYTVGHDIVFGAEEYAPDTVVGQRLLAHELTHVVQQANVAPGRPVVQCQRFRDCTPGITGAAMTQDQIDNLLSGSRMAGELVSVWAETAVRRISQGAGTAAETAAFANNFGAPTPTQTNTILRRFATISRRLGNESLFICNTAGSFYCSQNWCAYTPCPSPGGYTHLCPPTFQTPLPCAEPDVDRMMLHEAAHAAGACNDVYPGAGYPPANAHNNAPSYAGFAYEVF